MSSRGSCCGPLVSSSVVAVDGPPWFSAELRMMSFLPSLPAVRVYSCLPISPSSTCKGVEGKPGLAIRGLLVAVFTSRRRQTWLGSSSQTSLTGVSHCELAEKASVARTGPSPWPARLTKLPERLVGPPGMPSDADAVYYARSESPGWPLRYAMFGSIRCCLSPQAPWMLLFRSQPFKCVRDTPALKADFSNPSPTAEARSANYEAVKCWYVLASLLVMCLPLRQVEPVCCYRKLDCRTHCLDVWSPFVVVCRRCASQVEEGQVAQLRP